MADKFEGFRVAFAKMLILSISLLLLSSAPATSDAPNTPPSTIFLCSSGELLPGIKTDLAPRRCLNKDEFPSIWHYSKTLLTPNADQLQLIACTSKDPRLNYFHIKSECRKHQQTLYYYRSAKVITQSPEISEITGITRRSVDLEITLSENNPDAPVKYVEVSSINALGSYTQIIELNANNKVNVEFLNPGTSYTFKVRAISIDGSSPESQPSIEVKTLPALPPPLFELSTEAEIISVGSPIDGYTIIELGGPVDYYTISPDIESGTGLVFNTTTGALSGTAEIAIPETIYTITGFNESGSYSDTYTLTVVSFFAGPSLISVITFALITLVWVVYFTLRRRSWHQLA